MRDGNGSLRLRSVRLWRQKILFANLGGVPLFHFRGSPLQFFSEDEKAVYLGCAQAFGEAPCPLGDISCS